jgi:NACHT domain
VEHLRNRRARYSSNIGIAFIYCSNKIYRSYTTKFISSLTRQLILQCNGIPDPVKEWYEKFKKNTPHSFDAHLSLLSSVCQEFSKSFIIIDGLDEWPNVGSQDNRTEDNLSSALQDLTRFSRILVTSRSSTSIFEDVIKIHVYASESAINTYLESEIDKSSDFATRVRKNEGLMDQVVQKITRKSNRK